MLRKFRNLIPDLSGLQSPRLSARSILIRITQKHFMNGKNGGTLMDINVKIDCPDLTIAINALASAIKGVGPATPVKNITIVQKAAEPIEKKKDPEPTVEPEPDQPRTAEPATVSDAPKWTMEQLAHAGSDLVADGKRAEVINLLKKYGIKSLVKATEEQYNAIGEDLIALGAKL